MINRTLACRVAKKADKAKSAGRSRLAGAKGLGEFLPQQLQWYRFTGAQQGGALFASWPDSVERGVDAWTANVPDAVKKPAGDCTRQTRMHLRWTHAPFHPRSPAFKYHPSQYRPQHYAASIEADDGRQAEARSRLS
ncbi:hypothetical protein WJX73_010698 [Symbiochloris irregularis]|uniref:Uncharacterized protein n=1 Tax=Symbiochloris irregularis TaxID=706552 RepID=A0AAW1NTQ7_9CHLO